MYKGARMEEKCYICGKNLSKDDIGINKKLIDEELTKFLCVECLSNDIGVSIEDIKDKIEEFKEEGCKLFN